MTPPTTTRHRATAPEVTKLVAPPHDAAAEADLLAIAMHSAAGLEVLSGLNVDAFYTPSHRYLAEVLAHAFEHGWRPEVTLVLDQLRGMGVLDELGGPTLLADVLSRTPATSMAPRYAEVIERHWRARLWLSVARDIEEAAVSGDEARILGSITDRIGLISTVALDSGPPYADLGALLAGKVDERPPELMARTDGLALFYGGALNYVHGEPGKGKSWVAFFAASLALETGDNVAILDFEDTPRGVAGRLRALGVSDHVIANRAFYIEDPHSKPIRELVRLALGPLPRVVIIDGVSASMTAVNLDEDKAPDVNRWIDTLCRPIAATGAVLIAVDHVTKSKETRGLWPRGSGAKRARIDGAAYSVEAAVPFTRSSAGYLKLKLAKDRRGYVGAEGDTAAIFHLKPINEGETVTIRVETPRLEDEVGDGAGAKTIGVQANIADAILRILERDGPKEGPLNRDKLIGKIRALPGPGGRGTISVNSGVLMASAEWLQARGQIIRIQDGRKAGWALPARQQTLDEAEEVDE